MTVIIFYLNLIPRRNWYDCRANSFFFRFVRIECAKPVWPWLALRDEERTPRAIRRCHVIVAHSALATPTRIHRTGIDLTIPGQLRWAHSFVPLKNRRRHTPNWSWRREEKMKREWKMKCVLLIFFAKAMSRRPDSTGLDRVEDQRRHNYRRYRVRQTLLWKFCQIKWENKLFLKAGRSFG